MKYDNIKSGIFRSRPNRFIAEVEIDGHVEKCHVKNTERCKELLIPGVTVYVNHANKPERSTKYDLGPVATTANSHLLVNFAPLCVGISLLAFGQAASIPS